MILHRIRDVDHRGEQRGKILIKFTVGENLPLHFYPELLNIDKMKVTYKIVYVNYRQ